MIVTLRRLAGAVTVLVLCALVVLACGGSHVQSIGFGTGGSDCELEGAASTFPAGGTVRVVARSDPAPSKVTVSVTKDGVPLHDRKTVELDGSVPCVYGALPDVEAGHYEIVVTDAESKVPPLSGAFDVTP